MSRLTRVLLALGLVALVASWPSPAAAESRRGQLTYSCETAGEGYEDQAEPYSFGVALQVDVPTSVAPGDVLNLSGTFSVQFPEELRSLAEDYFTYVQAVSDTVTVPVTVNGRTTVLRASHFDSGRVATRNNPLILSGIVSAAPFTVPAGATGDLVVSLPLNDSAPSNIDQSRVAFNASALLSGGFVATFVEEYTYKTSCTHAAQAKRTVAEIPIVSAQAPGQQSGTTDPSTSAEQPVPDEPVAPGASVAPEAPPAAQPSAAGQPEDVAPEVAPDTAVDAAAPETTSGLATPTGPTATTSVALPLTADPSTVPGWALLLMSGVVVTAVMLLAGWSHHRVRMFRAELEG